MENTANRLHIEIEPEEDGRWLAAVPELPGVMAYGATQEEAARKAKVVALQILADMIESGEELPEPIRPGGAGLWACRRASARRR